MAKTNDEDLLEKLADAEHASWAHWMDYLFSKCKIKNGDYVIPAALAYQWRRQIDTPYAGLSEPEKESDRQEVRKILPLIEAWHQRILAGMLA